MKVLCDTHALAWWLLDDARLSGRVRTLIIDTNNEIWVSAISAFEIATKHRIGKWPDAGEIARDFENAVTAEGFKILPVTVAHACRGGLLTGVHRDPFDRLIAAQSLTENMQLMTRDAEFRMFGVETVW